MNAKTETKDFWDRMLSRPPLYAEPDLKRWEEQDYTLWDFSRDGAEPPGGKLKGWFAGDAQGLAFWKHAPFRPLPADPTGTIGRRTVNGITKGRFEEETELLFGMVINKDASRKELVSAFAAFLESEGLGTDHRKKGQRDDTDLATLETLALRRLYLASSDPKNFPFWDPMKGNRWIESGDCFYPFANCKPAAIRDRCKKKFERLKDRIAGFNG